MLSFDIDSDRKACRCDHDLNAFECFVDIKEVGLFVFCAAFVSSVQLVWCIVLLTELSSLPDWHFQQISFYPL